MTFIQLPDGRKSKLNCSSRQVSRCHSPCSRCHSPSSRAQNRHFCALFAFGALVFGLFEHEIGFFVRFLPLEPLFSGFSSTKSGFLCFFGLRNPRFRAFRAQNRGFCALLPFGTLVFGHFEHKIGLFVLVCGKRGTWKAQFCHKNHLEGAVSA